MTLKETLTMWRELVTVIRRRDELACRLSQEPADRLEAAYALLAEEMRTAATMPHITAATSTRTH